MNNATIIRFPTGADLRKTHAMATKRSWLSRLFKPTPKRASRPTLIINRAMRVTK
jgi:hypothetical protein